MALLDVPEDRARRTVQHRLAVIAGRIDRVAVEHQHDADAPVVPIYLDGLRIDPALLREQITWLENHDSDEARGLLALADAVLDRTELGRSPLGPLRMPVIV